MIKKFKQFELKQSTYNSAASKAKDYGHKNRANRLKEWSIIAGTNDYTTKTAREVGKFNFDFNIYTNTRRYDRYDSFLNTLQSRKQNK